MTTMMKHIQQICIRWFSEGRSVSWRSSQQVIL